MNPEITVHHLIDDGVFPNNPILPVLLYHKALPSDNRDVASAFEVAFHKHGWGSSWRNGIYDFHHYHSTAHEVLGIACGEANVQFGGPQGAVVAVRTGDMIVVPAGVAHKLLDSRDLLVIGAYPDGQRPDMCYGNERDRPAVDERIRHVPLPVMDPLSGNAEPLLLNWMVNREL